MNHHSPARAYQPDPAAQPRRGLMAAMTAFLILVSTVVTYASWNAGVTNGAVIASGNLNLTLGDMTWECASQCINGNADPGLEDFAIAPGQSLVLNQPVSSQFVGDNLAIELSANFETLPDSLQATWHVEVAGSHVAPASGDVLLGEALVLPPHLTGTNHNWTLVITLTDASDQTWIDPADDLADPPEPAAYDLGALTVSANQIRCGDGFTTTCMAGETEADDGP